MMPETIQTVSRSPGLCTCAAISAETMKIPEPIIEPQTIIVESKRPSPLTNSDWPAATPALGKAASAIRAAPRSLARTPRVKNFRRDAQIFCRAFGRLPCRHQIANHGDRIGAGAIDRLGVFRRDSATRHNRFPGHGSRARYELQAHPRIRILLGGGRKHRPDGDVFRRTVEGGAKLIEIVRRNSHP